MMLPRTAAAIGLIVCLSAAGCLEEGGRPNGPQLSDPHGPWTEEVDKTVQVPWRFCLPPSAETCPVQAIDPRDTLRFGAPNATLIDVRLEVVFPHPDEPPFATAIQDLLVLAQCAPADFNECGRFAGPSEFRGPSPLSVLLEGLKIPPPGELVLEFRIPDASPSDEVIFEFDPRVAAHVTGEVRFLAVDEPS